MRVVLGSKGSRSKGNGGDGEGKEEMSSSFLLPPLPLLSEILLLTSPLYLSSL